MNEWDEKTAEWYAEKYGEYATNRIAVEEIVLFNDIKVVDVGCGTGSALRNIADQCPSAKLIGVDPVPRMIEIARARSEKHPEGHRIEFKKGVAENLPLANDSSDLVLAFDSFDHWKDKSAGFREIRRVLRRKGRLVVVKDGGLPGGKKAKQNFLDELAHAQFVVVEEKILQEGDVTCTMWVCVLA